MTTSTYMTLNLFILLDFIILAMFSCLTVYNDGNQKYLPAFLIPTG